MSYLAGPEYGPVHHGERPVMQESQASVAERLEEELYALRNEKSITALQHEYLTRMADRLSLLGGHGHLVVKVFRLREKIANDVAEATSLSGTNAERSETA